MKVEEAVMTDYDPEKLIVYRMAAELTQLGLAQAIGAKASDVARWELGAKGIPLRMIPPLTYMLRCTEEDLKGQ